MELKLERRFAKGYSYLVGYTFSRSKDTRSFDPAFTRVAAGNAQSASSTPFDIHNRDLNYALSDFDRPHVLQGHRPPGNFPSGRGGDLQGDVSRLTDVLIGGWTLSGQSGVSERTADDRLRRVEYSVERRANAGELRGLLARRRQRCTTKAAWCLVLDRLRSA